MKQPDSIVDIFSLPVHPAADMWPPMSEAELRDLADDIKANGMLNPILLGPNDEGVLCVVDGLNRREACRLAGVEAPAFTMLADGADARTTIVSANAKRRHQSEGQRTMVVALMYPEPAKVKRAGSAMIADLHSGRLSKARAVARECNINRRHMSEGQRTMMVALAYPEPAKLKRGSGKIPDLAVDQARLSKARAVLKESEALAAAVVADPVALILSSNINRRHMTKGQRAMAVAKISPESQQGKKGGTSSVSKEVSGVYLSQARAVIKWVPELADAVLAGAESLDKAYAVASDRKTKAEVPQKRLQVLRASDPELADRVIEQQLTLDEADALKKSKLETARIARQGTYDCMREIDKMMFLFREGSYLDDLVKTWRNHPDEPGAARIAPLIDKWIVLLTNARKALT